MEFGPRLALLRLTLHSRGKKNCAEGPSLVCQALAAVVAVQQFILGSILSIFRNEFVNE
jgi:hypothetical protein